MMHWSTDQEDPSFYGVGCGDNRILVQLGNPEGEQLRVSLRLDHAKHMVEMLEHHIHRLESTNHAMVIQ